MLSVPPKRGNPSNVVPTLKSFVSSEFPDEVGKFDGEINFFQQIRQNAVSVVESSDESVQMLLRYNYHVSSISKKLSNNENSLNFSFTWFDAFRPNKSFVSASLFFDRECILWNMGAFESMKGSQISRDNEDGIRTACRHFQQAAGIFKYIKENITRNVRGGCTPDLSEDGIEFAKQLMIAQAQVCYYEKAVRDRKATGAMKPIILAKLANQASAYYKSVFIVAKTGTVSASLDASWAAHLDFQTKMFAGVSDYWGAMHSKELASQQGYGYGEEIARLQSAETHLKAAIEVIRVCNLSPSLKTGPEQLLSAVSTRKLEAEKDNKLVYVESVPPLSSLSDLGVVSMVQTVGLPVYETEEKSIFQNMLPKSVRAIAHKYSQESEALVHSLISEAEAASNEARTQLNTLGLPGTLEIYKAGGSLPENLWQKVLRVQTAGGVTELHRKHSMLEEAAERSKANLLQIETCLEREETTDEMYRRQYPKWSGTPSYELSKDIKYNRQRLYEAYSVAREKDRNILSEIQESSFADNVTLLTLTKQELTSKLISMGEMNLLEMSSQIDTTDLETALISLAELVEERNKIILEIQQLFNKDIIQEICIDIENNMEESNIILKYMSEYDPIKLQLQTLYTKQQSLLSSITSLYQSFKTAHESDIGSIEKEKFLQQIESSCIKFFSLHSQLTAGCTFYADLQSKVSSLLQSADDLSYTQQLLRSEYEIQLSRAYEQGDQEEKDRALAAQLAQEYTSSLSPSSGVSPPPPPPPLPNSSGVVVGVRCPGPPPGASPLNLSTSTSSTSSHRPPAPSSSQSPPMGYHPPPVPSPSASPSSGAPVLYYPSTNTSAVSHSPTIQYPSQTSSSPHYYIPPQSSYPPSQPSSSSSPSQQYTSYNQPSSSSSSFSSSSYSQDPSHPSQQYHPSQSTPSMYAPASVPGYPPVPVPAPTPQASQQQYPSHYTQQYPQQAYPQHQTYPSSSSSSSSSSSGPTPAEISRLVEMGFSHDAVTAALIASNGNQDQALNSLLTAPSASHSHTASINTSYRSYPPSRHDGIVQGIPAIPPQGSITQSAPVPPPPTNEKKGFFGMFK